MRFHRRYLRSTPDKFRIASLLYEDDLSECRWTLDDPRDFTILRHVYDELGVRGQFGHLDEVLTILKERPEIELINTDIETQTMDDVLKQSDFISLHVPAQKGYVIGKAQIDKMKDGVAIVNAARGGVIDEAALVNALDSGKISFAALDTFENEPTPAIQVLMNGKLSLTPHIGAATNEAQDRIGTELASQIIRILKA